MEKRFEHVAESDPTYSGMNVVQKFGLELAQVILGAGVALDYFDIRNVTGKVLDFGCGNGGPTYALAYNGADVTGVDLDANSINTLIETGILSPDRAIVGDGIEFMRGQPDNSYDLITAFMLDPTFGRDPTLLRSFYQEAQRVIKENGAILLQSDVGTRMGIKRDLGDQVITLLPHIREESFVGYKPGFERSTSEGRLERVNPFQMTEFPEVSLYTKRILDSKINDTEIGLDLSKYGDFKALLDGLYKKE